MESTFLEQDVDGVFFANKCIVIGCFVGGTITKFSLRRESSWTISESRNMGSDLVLTECYCRQILRFTISPIDLIHFERVSSSTYAFLNHDLADASHVPMIISKLWGHENATGFLNFGLCVKDILCLHFAQYSDLLSLHGHMEHTETLSQGRYKEGYFGRTMEVDLL